MGIDIKSNTLSDNVKNKTRTLSKLHKSKNGHSFLLKNDTILKKLTLLKRNALKYIFRVHITV